MRVSAAPSPEKRPAAKKKKLASTCSKSEATYAWVGLGLGLGLGFGFGVRGSGVGVRGSGFGVRFVRVRGVALIVLEVGSHVRLTHYSLQYLLLTEMGMKAETKATSPHSL